MLKDADRIQHDVEIPPCAQSHESYKFSTRCQWFYFACCRRALGGLQIIREKAVRNLSRLLPNGYQSVNAILPEAYNETAMMVSIELSSAAFLRRLENVDRWLRTCGYLSELLLRKDRVEAMPLFCIEDILSVLSVFE